MIAEANFILFFEKETKVLLFLSVVHPDVILLGFGAQWSIEFVLLV